MSRLTTNNYEKKRKRKKIVTIIWTIIILCSDYIAISMNITTDRTFFFIYLYTRNYMIRAILFLHLLRSSYTIHIHYNHAFLLLLGFFCCCPMSRTARMLLWWITNTHIHTYIYMHVCVRKKRRTSRVIELFPSFSMRFREYKKNILVLIHTWRRENFFFLLFSLVLIYRHKNETISKMMKEKKKTFFI